jgi:hypothetical protein
MESRGGRDGKRGGEKCLGLSFEPRQRISGKTVGVGENHSGATTGGPAGTRSAPGPHGVEGDLPGGPQAAKARLSALFLWAGPN